jgi:hypothetical protein
MDRREEPYRRQEKGVTLLTAFLKKLSGSATKVVSRTNLVT